MKTISVVNYKGGTGKTTVSYNMAYELSIKNNKVLLIDLDGQGNLSKLAGINNNVDLINKTISNSIISVIRNKKEVEISIYKTNTNNIDIIPCNVHMADTKNELMMALARETILSRIINEIRKLNFYDYVIIDNAPSVEIDFINSIVASDEIIIVASPDTFSSEGINNLLKKYRVAKEYFNKNVKISGILINNADVRTNFTKDIIKIMDNSYKNIRVFNTVIPSSIRVRESQSMNLAISEYERGNNVSKAFRNFINEYLESEV